MEIRIACFKNAGLERKFKTGDKFLPRRGAADFGGGGEEESAAVEMKFLERGIAIWAEIWYNVRR